MHLLTGAVKNYDWGSPTALPEFLGVAADGQPQAEYWLGAHPGGPAQLDGQELDGWLAAHPQCLGEPTRQRFGDRFPYLMKFLAAEHPLSLQAHPSAAQAQAGYAAENAAGVAFDAPNRSFKDPYPKPEMIVALTPMEALAGFRDPAQTLELFDALHLSASLEPIIGPLRHRSGEAAMAEVFLDCLCLDPMRSGRVEEVVAACLSHVDDPGELGRFARVAVRLDEFFPGDPSLLAALLLNVVTLQPGEALSIDAGVLHAYLHGVGIEILASSDNVLRGGLTSKHIDVHNLIQVVDFRSGPPPLVEPVQLGQGLWRYPSPAAEFALWRAQPGQPASGQTPSGQTASAQTVALPGAGTPRIVLVVSGQLALHNPGTGSNPHDARTPLDALTLRQGQACFVEAAEEPVLSGQGECFIAAPNLDADPTPAPESGADGEH